MKSLKQIRQLPFVEFKDRKQLPNSKGIYFVVFDNKLLAYVGMTSSSFYKRWLDHSVAFACSEIILSSADWQWSYPLICIHYQEMLDSTKQEIYQKEQALIRYFQRPLWNATQGGKSSRSVLQIFGTSPYPVVDKQSKRQEESEYWENVYYCRQHNLSFERREEFHELE